LQQDKILLSAISGYTLSYKNHPAATRHTMFIILMKRFRKALRFSGLLFLIIAASLGVGLTGGIPVPVSGKKENTVEIKAEWIESGEDKTTMIQFKSQQ
jgi:hypothetical protein